MTINASQDICTINHRVKHEPSTTNPAPNWSEVFGIHSIKPVCIKIVDATDEDKSMLDYDAEIYEGDNDSNIMNCLTTHLTNDIGVTISQLSMSINLHQQQNPDHHLYSINDISSKLHNNSIVQMKINIEKQQMDSGANRNVTDDRCIIRNYLDIKPIPVFGIGKDEVACEIIGKGITELTTTDGTTLAINIFFRTWMYWDSDFSQRHCS